jgi:hypothetical protein
MLYEFLPPLQWQQQNFSFTSRRKIQFSANTLLHFRDFIAQFTHYGQSHMLHAWVIATETVHGVLELSGSLLEN